MLEYDKPEETNVNQHKKRAILVVSFGTSYANTRKLTIEAIEKEIEAAFSQYRVYRAWTSKKIIAKLKKTENCHIFTVAEAMEQMALDGIKEVIVQPTHMLNAIENDTMKEEVLAFIGRFDAVVFGNPVLTEHKDHIAVINAVTQEFSRLEKNTALVLMGHGTHHDANCVYAELDRAFKEEGHANIFLGTVEACPGMDVLLEAVRAYAPEKVILAPFMIVAGDHAKNDMAGDEEDSWINQFKKAGFRTEAVLKGLGEYEGIRKLLVQHVKAAQTLL